MSPHALKMGGGDTVLFLRAAQSQQHVDNKGNKDDAKWSHFFFFSLGTRFVMYNYFLSRDMISFFTSFTNLGPDAGSTNN